MARQGIYYALKLSSLLLTDMKVSDNAYNMQQTRDIHPMLFQCWASVGDGGPTLKQYWVNVSCLLGIQA